MNKNFFKLHNKFKKREHQPDPDVYWRYIFGVGFLGVIAMLVFGLSLFFHINAENFSGQAEYAGQGNKIKKTRVDNALLYFTNREAKSQSIINTPVSYQDPGI